MHPYKPGDAVWVKKWNVQLLKPHWKGLFAAVLSTPTEVKVAEIIHWIHFNRVKPVSLEWQCIPDTVSPYKITLKTLEPFPDRTLLPRGLDISPALVTPEAD
jgi:hypothetical protein